MDSMARPSLGDICHYHILDGILSNLSASEAACFLATLNVLKYDQLDFLRKKYVNPVRDLPEYADWIETMISKGHRVFIVGRDVSSWMERLYDPTMYWKDYTGGTTWDEKPLRLWLAIRANKEHSLRSIAMNGDAICSRQRRSLRDQGMILTNSNVIPLPGVARSRYGRRGLGPPYQEGPWEKSPKLNRNNLQIVWAHSINTDGSTPHVRMCPLQVGDRGPGDIMGGHHDSRGNRCERLSPGSILKPSPYAKAQVIPRMPYIEMGAESQMKLAEVLDPEGSDPNNYAFTFTFRCFGESKGPLIRADTQGIPC